jgi:hypothetical protein
MASYQTDKNTQIYRGIEEPNNLIVGSQRRIVACHLKSKKEIMKVQLGLF